MRRSSHLNCLMVLTLCTTSRVLSQIEEFHISSPMDLNSLAMDKFLQYRKDVDPQASLDYDSPLMKVAHDYAVRRFSAKSEIELKVRDIPALGEIDSEGNALLLLPAPDSASIDGDLIIAAAVSTQVTTN